MECQFNSTTSEVFKFAASSRLWSLPGGAIISLIVLIALADGSAGLAQVTSNTAIAQPATSTAGKPVFPSFRVQRYEVIGSAAVSQETINRVMSAAIGDAVSVSQIRRALLKLQQAFRDRGYPRVSVTLPQQPITNGLVRVCVSEGPASFAPDKEAAELQQWSPPAYDVRHFEVHGNTVLTPEQIDEILSPAAAPAASLEQLHKALFQLQIVYRERGLARASVTLPQQLLTDGTVVVQVNEGSTPETQLAAKAERIIAPQTPATPAAPRTFEVRHYELVGNTLLRPETIDPVFDQAKGTNVTIQQIQKVVGDLQLAYRERGFATVNVGLPQQQLTNATVKVRVTEGRLVDVRVTGNHYFSSNNVMRALPSLAEALIWKDEVVNSRVLQREVDLANQNRDRQVYPVINPGPDPGTSALDLRVKDRLPLHGRLELNNDATPGTPEWRINTTVNYNNLWQLEHSLGLFYGFTPEVFKSGGQANDYFFNRPLIANYGAYYRIPFGNAESVQERVSHSSTFGYDEATHQFRLPPPGGRPDLTFSLSGSSSDTGVILGPANLVTNTALLRIVSQDSGQELTINQGAGAGLNVPFAVRETQRFNFFGGLDWKHDERDSYNTNNFIITTTVTNETGSQTIESRFASPQPTRHSNLTYLPLNMGLDFSETDTHGSLSARIGLSGNFVGDSTNFTRFSYSRKASADYGKATFAFTRDQKVLKNWSLLFRASGQAATGALISDEQFTLGGVNSVRGYLDADERGDDGWFGSLELRTPPIATTVPAWSAFVPAWVRGSIFVDAGQRILLESVGGLDRSRFLWGAGFGLSANINNHVDMRIAVGWPLLDAPNTHVGDPLAYFSLGGQF